jgi:hypothetical protein
MPFDQEHLRQARQPSGPPEEPEGSGAAGSAPKYSRSMPGAVGAIGDGATVVRNSGDSGGAASHKPVAEPSLSAVYDLLVAAFTPEDLVRFFKYSPNSALRPVVNDFGPVDGLSTLADKAVTFCEKRGLLPDLLAEVQRKNPAMFARHEPMLWGSQAGAPVPPEFSSAAQREMLQQELVQHEHNLRRLRAQKAIYAAGEEPLHLLNQIDHEVAEIQRLEAELQSFTGG